MSWIVIYTRPRQEMRAKENLQNLGLKVSFVSRPVEKIVSGTIMVRLEPLFPRYIFVKSDSDVFLNVVHQLRNIRGVSNIVKFGNKYAELNEDTYEEIVSFEKKLSTEIVKAHTAGDNVSFTHGAFKRIQAVYDEPDGDKRVILLFDLLNKRVRMSVPVGATKSL